MRHLGGTHRTIDEKFFHHSLKSPQTIYIHRRMLKYLNKCLFINESMLTFVTPMGSYRTRLWPIGGKFLWWNTLWWDVRGKCQRGEVIAKNEHYTGNSALNLSFPHRKFYHEGA